MKPTDVDIDALLADSSKVEAALQTAVRRELARHKAAGNRIVVWQDGKIVWLPPEEIPDFNEEEILRA